MQSTPRTLPVLSTKPPQTKEHPPDDASIWAAYPAHRPLTDQTATILRNTKLRNGTRQRVVRASLTFNSTTLFYQPSAKPEHNQHKFIEIQAEQVLVDEERSALKSIL